MEYIERCHKITVQFDRRNHRLWAVTWFDAEARQLAQPEWYTKKCEAVDTAIAYLDSDRCESVSIFLRDGELQTIEAKTHRIDFTWKK